MALISWALLWSGTASAKTPKTLLSSTDKTVVVSQGEAAVLTLPYSAETVAVEVEGQPLPVYKNPLNNPKDSSITIVTTALDEEDERTLTLQPQNSKQLQTLTLQTNAPEYPSETLTVNPEMVKPPEHAQERIKRERTEIANAHRITTPDAVLTKPFQLPLQTNTVTSPFGVRRTYNGEVKSRHTGVDFRAANGTPIMAPSDGVVKMAQNNWYTGGHIIIEHGWGVTTSYFHLSDMNVKPGDKVTQGQIIGLTGDTGRVTGPHLHWGVSVRGVPVNPMQFTADTVAFFDGKQPMPKELNVASAN